jgi:hypothetical protein
VSLASSPATRLAYPTSQASPSAGEGRTSIVCQCMSMRPGINVRPPPSTTVASAALAISGAILAILLPTTSTATESLNRADLPSKTLTFWKSVDLGATASKLCACKTGPPSARKVADTTNKQSPVDCMMHRCLTVRSK